MVVSTNSTPKNQDLTQYQQKCERLLNSVEGIPVTLATPCLTQHRKCERRLFLNLVASAQGLPRSECRKLFEVWLNENSQNL